jgi:RimJ/RimL family protein N-acetyltransferase
MVPAMPDREASTLDSEAMRAPIITRRLFLRAYQPTDVPALMRLLSDPLISRNVSGLRCPYAAIEGWRFIRFATSHGGSRGGAHFVATLRDNPRQIVGGCGLNWGRGEGVELGYWIAAGQRRRGFAGDAARALLSRLFITSGTQIVQAWTRTDNIPSQRVLLRAGFNRTGTGMVFSKRFARYVPAIRYAMRRADWAGAEVTRFCRDQNQQSRYK